MAVRSAEIKAYVLPDVKAKASEIYAHWGMSLSDAINAFLVKLIDEGGLPFDMRLRPVPHYDPNTVLAANPHWGSSIVPADMGDEEDDTYEHLVR